MFDVPCQVAMVGQNNEHQNQVNINMDTGQQFYIAVRFNLTYNARVLDVVSNCETCSMLN